MESNQLHVKFEGDESQVKTLIVRQGSAIVIKEPTPVKISGTITAVFSYIDKIISLIDQKQSHIIVNRDDLSFTLFVDVRNFYKDEIKSSLTFSMEFKFLEINTGESYSTFDLADKIKANRSFFESKEVAMKLVSELRNFKAKVDKDLELSKDDRANYSIKKVQIVESNIPKSFKLHIPIFKGLPKQIIEVEISIDPNNFNCMLLSPDANDIIEETKNSLIDEQLQNIIEIAPEMPIIEV